MNDRETLELARNLVRINSVNPRLVPGAPGEEQIALFIHQFLERHGVASEMVEAEPGRPNVVARLPGAGDGPSLLLCCHMDTVSAEGMAEPFEARVDQGRLYGRGAHDVKGGLAAMLAATVVLSKGRPRGGEIVAAAVVDEEYRSAGAEALVRSLQADAAVVFEPSDLKVLVAHKGFAWFDIETHGVAAHGSRPSEGVDAIVHMGRVLVALEALDARLRSIPAHPYLGTPSVHASLIEGGRELSSYPDRCLLQLERRTIPGEMESDGGSELQELLGRLSEEDPRFHAECQLRFARPPYEISTSHALPQAMARAVERATQRGVEFGGLTAWTDSAILASAAIPSVIFGPGGAGLHALEEYAQVQDLFDCRDVLVELAQEYCRRGSH
jgi:acetylornithine deacetylase/succinyl-diaminopimelate desuccinylase family protein